MLELRKCIQDIIDSYGVEGLKDEWLVRGYIRQNRCGGEEGKALLLRAVKRIPELGKSGMTKADIPAAIRAELSEYNYEDKAANAILQTLTDLLYVAPEAPKAEKAADDKPQPADSVPLPETVSPDEPAIEAVVGAVEANTPSGNAPVRTKAEKRRFKLAYLLIAVIAVGIIALLFYPGSGKETHVEEAPPEAGISAEHADGAPAEAGKSAEGEANNTQVSVSDELLASANNGDAEAQYKVGNRYYTGDGAVKNLDEAVKWFTVAALQGQADAAYKLGVCYFRGLGGLKKDYRQALSFWQEAREGGSKEAVQVLSDIQNNPDYQYYLGRQCENNDDHMGALVYYDRAAKQNHAEAKKAAVNLRGYLAQPPEPIKNCGCITVQRSEFKLSDRFSAVLSKANKGDAKAQLEIGCAYYDGYYVGRDYQEAAKWWKQAALRGNVPAQINLGCCYFKGEGVSADRDEAYKWYESAAGDRRAKAQYNLGVWYYTDGGYSPDYQEGLRWFRKAAEQGHIKAQYNLGVYYFIGKGTSPDKAEAVRWYRKAAENGDTGAQYNLGCCYYTGEGIAADKAEAVKWYKRAAQQGSADAQYNLGCCYDKGEGVTADKNEAIKWYAKAAGRGHKKAKYNLSLYR